MFFSGIADEAGQSLLTQIAAHQQLGWNQIELRAVDGVNITQLSDEDFKRVAGLLGEAGIKISCFASAIANWGRKITGDFQQDLDDLRQAGPRMRQVGTQFIRIMSYPNDGLPEKAYRVEVFRRLRELTHIAENEGVVLAHENCSGYGGRSGAHSLELLQELDSPAFKLIYDTGNPVQHGVEAWPFYQAVRGFITYVHIKDARHLPEGKHAITMCGEGDGQVLEVIKDLLASGYDGGFSIEPHLAAMVHEGQQAGVGAIEIYVAYGRRLVALIQQARGELNLI